jgi:UTP--glucose-1-phosphate uridylyltransferase
VVSSKIFSVLAKQGLSRDNELWFADAVNTLAKDDVAIAQPVENGRWMTTGDPLRWLKANIDFALAREDLKGEIKEFMSQKLKVSKN